MTVYTKGLFLNNRILLAQSTSLSLSLSLSFSFTLLEVSTFPFPHILPLSWIPDKKDRPNIRWIPSQSYWSSFHLWLQKSPLPSCCLKTLPVPTGKSPGERLTGLHQIYPWAHSLKVFSIHIKFSIENPAFDRLFNLIIDREYRAHFPPP